LARSTAVILAIIALDLVTALEGRCSSALAATVILSPGSNIQRAVNANPPATIFILEPGIYRGNARPKNGDSFIGRKGAVMDGARVLTGWTKVSLQGNEYWTINGGPPLPSPILGCTAGAHCCLPAYPRCEFVQDLYVDNIDYRHATSLASLASPMTWYYDVDGTDGGIRNNIYLGTAVDPNSHIVELGDKTYAFRGIASDITIKNLIIEKYAAPVSSAAVQVEGPHWLIENNEVRLNHGVGISAKRGGDQVRVVGNRLHHNGQFGIGGPANGGLWDSNYVEYNNVDGVNPDFGAGGSKFAGNYITISDNVVHDNYGPGLWTDDGGIHDTYDHNTVYDNFGGGIRYEISRYGVITNNTVYGNTKNAQIVYTGSDHGRISGNRVIDGGHGAIIVVNTVGTRPRSREPIYRLVDTQVTGNTIESECNPHAIPAVGLIDRARPPEPGIFSDPTNFFDHNVYRFPNGREFGDRFSGMHCWIWGENTGRPKAVSWSAWRVYGQDPNGVAMPVQH
jgi:parallel beta-helix repeat protein